MVLPLQPGERWWGGAVADGTVMPFGSTTHHRDLGTNAGYVDDPTAGANQSAPLLISDPGRYVQSTDPFTFTFTPGRLTLRGNVIDVGDGETATLAGAFRAASHRYFPPVGRAPAEAMFNGPQYNTWMELPYAPTQVGVLEYVRGLLDTGFATKRHVKFPAGSWIGADGTQHDGGDELAVPVSPTTIPWYRRR